MVRIPRENPYFLVYAKEWVQTRTDCAGARASPFGKSLGKAGGCALPPRDSRAKRKASPLFPSLTPPNPHAKLAGAFVIRAGIVASFSNPFSAMHESAMRIRPLSCPFDGEVEEGRTSKCVSPGSGGSWCVGFGRSVRKRAIGPFGARLFGRGRHHGEPAHARAIPGYSTDFRKVARGLLYLGYLHSFPPTDGGKNPPATVPPGGWPFFGAEPLTASRPPCAPGKSRVSREKTSREGGLSRSPRSPRRSGCPR